jgi:Domain of unknown function (DUF4136)
MFARTASRARRPLPAALACLLAGCSGLRVETRSAPGVDLGAYTTYAWSVPPAPAATGGSVALDAPLEAELVREVDRGLAAKGLAEVPADEADLRVRYLVGVRERVQLSDPYYYDAVTRYEEGTLILDLVDAATGASVWRGVARARLRERSDERTRARRLAEAVAAILDRYPPGGRWCPAQEDPRGRPRSRALRCSSSRSHLSQGRAVLAKSLPHAASVEAERRVREWLVAHGG